ncbi:MAG: Asp-tRNA(Asn)/Glu-tRNA(Gln) amidotransferase subunit GatC [Desulfobulbaceae bacterium]|jgi:aspartyl-tRNA(Asn)/glutamyl-tRNA(Gln) amidotransferase subunit C|nr:Asp-tRNA(Asn)/Glu-tRNA(Gln) amidotransferase subunit GatC [Desulfobulbaceae bacterium]
MNITRDEVLRVAALARLKMDEEELAAMTGQLDAMLAYFELLKEVDTEGVIPTTHPFAKVNALRDDAPVGSLPAAAALANAPAATAEFFVVPRVL